MSESHESVADALASIERLLLPDEGARVDSCFFRISFAHDSGHLYLHALQMVEQARASFERDGHWFVAPKLTTHAERKGEWSSSPRPVFDPPIKSEESLPGLGDENFVWRGCGNNARGVIKMRVGRFVADLNMPSVADAERFARRLADVLQRS